MYLYIHAYMYIYIHRVAKVQVWDPYRHVQRNFVGFRIFPCGHGQLDYTGSKILALKDRDQSDFLCAHNCAMGRAYLWLSHSFKFGCKKNHSRLSLSENWSEIVRVQGNQFGKSKKSWTCPREALPWTFAARIKKCTHLYVHI